MQELSSKAVIGLYVAYKHQVKDQKILAVSLNWNFPDLGEIFFRDGAVQLQDSPAEPCLGAQADDE